MPRVLYFIVFILPGKATPLRMSIQRFKECCLDRLFGKNHKVRGILDR
jgi:hypothetical protein